MPVAAQAQSTFRLYAGLAPTTYKVSFDQNAPNTGFSTYTYKNRTAKSSYTAANVGGTWISHSGVYVDLSAQQSLAAKHDLWDNVTPNGGPQDFSHDGYTLTGGYAHAFGNGANISGFGGFLSSQTRFNAPKPPFSFSVDKFDSQGIFIGLGGGIPALGGQFTGSFAVAGMKGHWSDDNGYNVHADYTVGYSLGTGYTYKFTPAWGITADLKYQRYNYNFGVYSTTQPAYTVSEKILSTGVRLSYQF